MKPMKSRINKIERDINIKMSSKQKKLIFTEEDVESVKNLCINFKRKFGSYLHTGFIDESENIVTPNCYDDFMSEKLKKLCYILGQELSSCRCLVRS